MKLVALGNVNHLSIEDKWEIIPMHIYPYTLGNKRARVLIIIHFSTMVLEISRVE